MITGHEAEMNAIEQDNQEWEKDVKAQLRHIIATAQSQIDGLELTHDVFGRPFGDGENKVSRYALDAIVACADRIRKQTETWTSLQKQ